MKTDTLSEIRARLWNSLEMDHIRTTVLAALPLLPLGLGLMWWAIRTSRPTAAVLMVPVTGLVGIFVIPALFFWLWRVIAIFRKPEQYHFCTCELVQPHSQPLNRNAFSFMAVIEVPEGTRFAVETHSIFRVRNIPGPKMKDYAGKTVTLAWNRQTGTVVVIG